MDLGLHAHAISISRLTERLHPLESFGIGVTPSMTALFSVCISRSPVNDRFVKRTELKRFDYGSIGSASTYRHRAYIVGASRQQKERDSRRNQSLHFMFAGQRLNCNRFSLVL